METVVIAASRESMLSLTEWLAVGGLLVTLLTWQVAARIRQMRSSALR